MLEMLAADVLLIGRVPTLLLGPKLSLGPLAPGDVLAS